MATSSTARSNASTFRRDGSRNPLTFRTNWSAAARISSSLAGTVPSRSRLMLLHMGIPYRACRFPVAALRMARGEGRALDTLAPGLASA